jgi:hypothetical protein
MSALPTAWPAVAATLLTVLWANHGRSNLKPHCEMNREIVCLLPTLATMIEAQSTSRSYSAQWWSPTDLARWRDEHVRYRGVYFAA